MNKSLPLLPGVLVLVLVLAGCDSRPGTEPVTTPAPSGESVNADTTITQPTTERPVGQANAEEPETGTATGRPDSPRDLAPGTDGNTNPPPSSPRE